MWSFNTLLVDEAVVPGKQCRVDLIFTRGRFEEIAGKLQLPQCRLVNDELAISVAL
jgi:hypothetical protein